MQQRASGKARTEGKAGRGSKRSAGSLFRVTWAVPEDWFIPASRGCQAPDLLVFVRPLPAAKTKAASWPPRDPVVLRSRQHDNRTAEEALTAGGPLPPSAPNDYRPPLP